MAYRVTAEYVTLKVKDAAGAFVIVGFYKGGVVSQEVETESLQHHLDSGMVEEVDLDESGDDGAEVEVVEVETPARSASKGDWVAFATDEARGEGRLTEDEANGFTRDQLADRYSPA